MEVALYYKVSFSYFASLLYTKGGVGVKLSSQTQVHGEYQR